MCAHQVTHITRPSVRRPPTRAHRAPTRETVAHPHTHPRSRPSWLVARWCCLCGTHRLLVSTHHHASARALRRHRLRPRLHSLAAHPLVDQRRCGCLSVCETLLLPLLWDSCCCSVPKDCCCCFLCSRTRAAALF